ncbi:hypothetical protein M9Y10_014925 [Tritrichomonas musculus]|uniref:GP63-like n=1 Tax=Tritrichomonas musculus TaxID=1915356 RepID=A0ABR2L0U7_9EUKA
MLFTFIILSLSQETHFHHFCNHDFIQKQTNVQTISIKSTKSKKIWTLAKERKPIRIYLDFRIDGKDDQYQCVDSGQQITWQNTRFICTAEDIPKKTQKSALKGTMENVKNYLQKILLVDQVNGPYKVLSNVPNFFTIDSSIFAKDTDIYLSAFIRTYGVSDTLASAHYVMKDTDTHRPLQGAIYVNSRHLPNEIQDEYSNNTNFFYTVVHEICHALGISSESFQKYHPKDSNTPYKDPIVTLNDKKTGKKHTFLVTPYSHKFAVMQWGVESFTLDRVSVPSGIEIEDGGGTGTAGSHPECRIGNQDLMVGSLLQAEEGPYTRFTPLTAAILLDTGNYDIVWEKIQPLIWGNKDSIDGKHIKDFVTGPPANVFPQQYIYRPSNDPVFDYCGFTFKMLGGLNKFSISQNQQFNCSLEEWKKYSNTRDYCEAEKFYNPNGDDEIGGIWTYDFQIIHMPGVETCGTGDACIGGMRKCGSYVVADDEKSFNISIDGYNYQCNKDNENQIVYKIGNRQYPNGIKCPPAEQFIRTVKMMEEQQYLTGNPFDDNENSPKNKKGLSKGAIAGIVIACIIVIAAVAVLVFIIIKRKNKEDKEEKSEKEEV